MESVPDVLLAEIHEAIVKGEEGDDIERFASDLIAFLWNEELQSADEQIRAYLEHPASCGLSARETAILRHARAEILARRGTEERAGPRGSRRRQGARFAVHHAGRRVRAAVHTRLALGIVAGVLVVAIDVAMVAATLIVTMDLITWLLRTAR